jgi:hypothetical protein
VPRIHIVADDGRPALDERICTEDLSSAHFRRCLMERIDWAVADAQEMASHEGAWEVDAAVVGAAA